MPGARVSALRSMTAIFGPHLALPSDIIRETIFCSSFQGCTGAGRWDRGSLEFGQHLYSLCARTLCHFEGINPLKYLLSIILQVVV